MTPCESTPRRLAKIRLSATSRASSHGRPSFAKQPRQKSCSLGAGTFKSFIQCSQVSGRGTVFRVREQGTRAFRDKTPPPTSDLRPARMSQHLQPYGSRVTIDSARNTPCYAKHSKCPFNRHNTPNTHEGTIRFGVNCAMCWPVERTF